MDMTKILALMLAMILVAAAYLPRFEYTVPEVVEDILMPQHIPRRETVAAVVTHTDERISVCLSGYDLHRYLWMAEYDREVVTLEESEAGNVYRFRIRSYEASAIFLRMCLHGQLYCPEYILKINIPPKRGGDVRYTETIPGYAQEKKNDGLLEVFFRELLGGE